MKRLTLFAITAGLASVGNILGATPTRAELTKCWTTTRNSTKELKPFPCHVIFVRNAVFHVYVGRQKIEKRKIIIDIDLKEGSAKALFSDGSTRKFRVSVDEDIDIRLSGKGNYQMAFSMPSEMKKRIQARLESKEDDAPSRQERRGTLSDTPFRF